MKNKQDQQEKDLCDLQEYYREKSLTINAK